MEVLGLSERNKAKSASFYTETGPQLIFHPTPGATLLRDVLSPGYVPYQLQRASGSENQEMELQTQPSTDKLCHLKEVYQPHYESTSPSVR